MKDQNDRKSSNKDTEKSNPVLRALKKEPVLVVSALCMLVSMFFVPPSKDYVNYIDFRVLVLLFCLMAVVAGLQRHGLFNWLACKVLSGKMQRRKLFLLLILLPFFSSMLVTNDVALITFVPFAVLVLGLTGQQNYMIFIVVMQTVAANLGSMATPVGNPQNLYLYSAFRLSAADFFRTVLPFTLLALPLLLISVIFCKKSEITVELSDTDAALNRSHIFLHLILFLLCLLSVFHVLDYRILLAVICTALLIMDRTVFVPWTTVCCLHLSAFSYLPEISAPLIPSGHFSRICSQTIRFLLPFWQVRSSVMYRRRFFCPALRRTGRRFFLVRT